MPAGAFDQLKVLIVEDNPHMRTLLRALLHATGIKLVAEAGHGAAGLEQIRASMPDLILADLAMAPMNGIEFTLAVRNSQASPNPFVPVMMITGYTERARVEAARDAGVTEFLAKPITAQNLYARIAEIIERPRPFVRCAGYFGPDRRRKTGAIHAGPWRRHDDLGEIGLQ